MENKENFILKLYQSKSTVFTINEIALLFGKIKRENLKARINYHVKKGVLKNVRKGIYVKPDYNILELASKIYTPTYISLETVLEKEGVIFQHYKTIFAISYLTRKINIAGFEIQYRRIQEDILLDPRGISQTENYAIATKERAFLDVLYLYKDYYFNNLDVLDKEKILSLLEIYQSKKLCKRVEQFI